MASQEQLFSEKAEIMLLKHIVQSPSLLDTTHVGEELFFCEKTSNIFIVIKKLRDDGEEVSIPNISATLKSLKLSQPTAIIKTLGVKIADKDTSFKVAHKMLENLYKMRELNNIVSEASSCETKNVDSILEKIRNQIDSVLSLRDVSISSFSQGINNFLEDIKLKKKGELEQFGIKTGYPTIDKMTGGLKEGNVYVISGSTGRGKTCFSINLAYNIAKNNTPVAFLSLEMTTRELHDRLIARHMGINSLDVAARNLPEDFDLEKCKELEKIPLIVSEETDLSSDTLRSVLASLKHQTGAKIIFIDYIGLITHSNKNASLYQQFGEIAGLVKKSSKQLGIPIVLLAQTNRESMKSKASTASLAESFKISQDATFIGILEKGKNYEGELTEDERSVLKVVKNRHGPMGDIKLLFNKNIQKITEETIETDVSMDDIYKKW